MSSGSGSDLEGQQVGAYRLGARIGEGGMGNVLLAERSDGAYRQKVAVKVIRRGMDTEHVLQRFRTERQILATLSHPNISALLDGGSLPDGRPYLVMEHVDGERIDRWCDARRLTVRERIRLFLAVCDAVSFAHQRLVVHRDIKPGNVLVTNDGVPKLLDFGIAKLLAAEPGSALSMTGSVAGPMTPEYASPEQVWALPVTTATDVYALGVVLYELLTGHRPYRIARRTTPAVLEAIGKTEPVPPSAVRDPGGEEPAVDEDAVARARGTTPDGLRRQLRGDLDVVLLTALRKQPERRYPSVDAFAEDLRRHLDGRPVVARADSWAYRAGRFARRNAVPVAAASLAVASLVAGAAVATWQARVARAQRDLAEKRQQDTLRLTNAMLFELFDGIDQGPARARALLADRARGYLDELSREAPDDPALLHELASASTRLAEVQGGTRQGAGVSPDAQAARRSEDRAFALRQKLGALDPRHFENRREIALLQLQRGAREAIEGRPKDALATYERALAALQELARERPADVTTRRYLVKARLSVAQALGSADAVANVGRTADALPHLEEGIRVATALLAELPDDVHVRTSLSVLNTESASALTQLGRAAEAEQRLRRSIAVQEELVARHPDSVLFRRELAVAYGNFAADKLKAGDKAAALDWARRALPLYESIVKDAPADGDARRDLAIGLRNVGKATASAGDPRASLPLVERATQILGELAAASPDSAFLARQLAFTHLVASDSLRLAGEKDAALARIQRGIRIGEGLVRRDASNMTAWRTLAQSYTHAGETSEALRRWPEAKDWHEKGRDAWLTMQKAGELPPGRAVQLQQAEEAIARCAARLGAPRT